jgi:predicted DNA-binding protein (MmcQ/YjbR family)
MASDPLARVRKVCLELPNVWEKLSHGEPTFWVGKRTFASFADAGNHHGAGRPAIWCKSTPTNQELLIGQAPNRYFSPPYVGPSGWIGVYLDGRVSWKAVRDRLVEAHELALASQARPRSKR